MDNLEVMLELKELRENGKVPYTAKEINVAYRHLVRGNYHNVTVQEVLDKAKEETGR